MNNEHIVCGSLELLKSAKQASSEIGNRAGKDIGYLRGLEAEEDRTMPKDWAFLMSSDNKIMEIMRLVV